MNTSAFNMEEFIKNDTEPAQQTVEESSVEEVEEVIVAGRHVSRVAEEDAFVGLCRIERNAPGIVGCRCAIGTCLSPRCYWPVEDNRQEETGYEEKISGHAAYRHFENDVQISG